MEVKVHRRFLPRPHSSNQAFHPSCVTSSPNPNTRKEHFPDDTDGAEQPLRIVQFDSIRYFVKLENRGSLRRLIYYDTVCFLLISIIMTGFLIDAHMRGTLTDEWQWRTSLYGARTGYAVS